MEIWQIPHLACMFDRTRRKVTDPWGWLVDFGTMTSKRPSKKSCSIKSNQRSEQAKGGAVMNPSTFGHEAQKVQGTHILCTMTPTMVFLQHRKGVIICDMHATMVLAAARESASESEKMHHSSISVSVEDRPMGVALINTPTRHRESSHVATLVKRSTCRIIIKGLSWLSFPFPPPKTLNLPSQRPLFSESV